MFKAFQKLTGLANTWDKVRNLTSYCEHIINTSRKLIKSKN